MITTYAPWVALAAWEILEEGVPALSPRDETDVAARLARWTPTPTPKEAS